MLPAMILVAASWLVLGGALLGIGLSLRRLWLAAAPLDGEALWTSVWLGYAAVIAALQLVHLVWPIGSAELWSIVVCGLAALGWNLPALRAYWDGKPARRPLSLALTAMTLWLANRSLGAPLGDSGLYHLSAIEWNHAFAVVPGLGNLHTRLGYNNAALLWGAALDSSVWAHRGFHLANSVLVWLWLLRIVDILVGARASRRPLGPGAVSSLALIAPLMVIAVSPYELRLTCNDSDVQIALVAWALLSVVLRNLGRDGSVARDGFLWAWSGTLLALLVCLKLSAAVWAALTWLAIGWLFWRRMAGDPRTRRRALAVSLLAGALLVVPWVVGTAILSGYPFFPSGALALPLEWRIPRAVVADEQRLIHTYFMPQFAMEMWRKSGGWLRPWVLYQVTRCFDLVFLPLGLLAGCVLVLRQIPSRIARAPLAALTAPFVLALAAWMISAPHPRFAFWMAWSLVAIYLSSRDGSITNDRRFWAACAALALFPIAYRVAAFTAIHDRGHALEVLLVPSGPDHGFHPTPSAPLETRTTDSGLAVQVPAPPGDQCWAQMLCTPRFFPGLALRKRDDVGAGFVLPPTTAVP